MIVPRYTGGDWLAVVTDGAVALLPPTTPAEVVTAVWASLRNGEDVAQQVEHLIHGGLRELPPFALLSVRGRTAHVIVRGQVDAHVTAPGGDRTMTGRHVATWSEEIVAEPTTVVLQAPSAPVGPELPVLSAVVRAAAVRLDLTRTGEPTGSAPAPEPDRAARPAPAPEPDPVVPPAPAPERVPAAPPAPEAPPVGVGPDPLGDLANTVMQPTSRAIADRSLAQAHPIPGMLTGAGPGVPPGDGAAGRPSEEATARHRLPDWAGAGAPGLAALPDPDDAPAPARILLSTGLVVALNRTILVGRAPQVSRVAASDLPRLVTVPSPNQDISRTHAEVRQEGENVLVTDLRSTNGVLLLREGAQPQRLHPGVPTVVESGVTVDLGDGVSFVVDHG